MANPIYGSPNFSTTLNVGGGINNSQTTGIVLTSVSGLNTNGGILGLTWAAALDTATYEEIEYTGVTGNELTGVTRGVAGTSAKSHLNGATVVAVVSSLHNNRVSDKLRSVDAVLSQDPNANEIIKTGYVASAVNEATVTNAATGSGPSVKATGGDTNIPLVISGKGTGGTSIEGVVISSTAPTANQVLTASSATAASWAAPAGADGWTAISDTLTYASATSVTISGVDRTTTYTKGTKVKFTNNSTTYYGVVASSSFSTNTTITFIANTDYSIANSAITAPYYSYDVNPQGYPAWFNYAITLTPGGSMTWGTVTTTYQRFRPSFGGTIDIQYHVNGTLGGSAANSATFNAPVSVTVVGQQGRFNYTGNTEYSINISSASNSATTLTAGTTVYISRVPATTNFDLGANCGFSLIINAQL